MEVKLETKSLINQILRKISILESVHTPILTVSTSAPLVCDEQSAIVNGIQVWL